MKSIKQIYCELEDEEEVFFQCKNKTYLKRIAEEIGKVAEKDWWLTSMDYLIDDLSVKHTWFILGKWRDGMFEIGIYPNGINNYSKQLHILADTKETESMNELHLKMIKEIIDIMDKYREHFIVKSVEFNDDFNIVKKGLSL